MSTTPPPDAPFHAPAASRGPQHRVLYIEDNPVNSLLMSAMLEVLPSVEMLAAATPEAGLALASAELPQLVLVDIQLPGMDGHEVLARLKADAQTRHIPVIAVTGEPHPGGAGRGPVAGFAAHLTKPLHLPHLLEAVCAALGIAMPAGLPRA